MKKKQKFPFKKYLAGAAGFLLGGLLGYSLYAYILGDGSVNVNPFLLLFLFAAAIYVQIILHEGGHLVFGLLSGYKFASFRIGSLMLMKDEKGFHWKRFSLAGTGGQCLLIPPEPVEGMIPVLGYNLGGPLMNLITGGLFLLLWAYLPMANVLQVSCLLLGVIGVAFGLMNGIPIHTDTIDNDGMNAFSLRKDPKANRALRIQLLINGKTTEGLRLKDMEDSWFEIPEDGDMKNPLISTLAVFAENRLMDENRIPEAVELAIEGRFHKSRVLSVSYLYDNTGKISWQSVFPERKKAGRSLLFFISQLPDPSAPARRQCLPNRGRIWLFSQRYYGSFLPFVDSLPF